MTDPTKDWSDETRASVFKALAHATRIRILRRMAPIVPEASPTDFSPRSLAEQLNITVELASHHVKRLAKGGLIEARGTRQVRGAVEHRYRITEFGRLVLERVVTD